MSVWGRGSGCQVAGSQRGTARRGLCSSAAPAADPVPPTESISPFSIHEPHEWDMNVRDAETFRAVQVEVTFMTVAAGGPIFGFVVLLKSLLLVR